MKIHFNISDTENIPVGMGISNVHKEWGNIYIVSTSEGMLNTELAMGHSTKSIYLVNNIP